MGEYFKQLMNVENERIEIYAVQNEESEGEEVPRTEVKLAMKRMRQLVQMPYRWKHENVWVMKE